MSSTAVESATTATAHASASTTAEAATRSTEAATAATEGSSGAAAEAGPLGAARNHHGFRSSGEFEMLRLPKLCPWLEKPPRFPKLWVEPVKLRWVPLAVPRKPLFPLLPPKP